MWYQLYTQMANYATIKSKIQYFKPLRSFLVQSVEVLRHKHKQQCYCHVKHYVLVICFNKPIRDHQTCTKLKFHIFQFCRTFDMLYLNVYLVQKCKKHLCCNLFWVPTQFDWTRRTALILVYRFTYIAIWAILWQLALVRSRKRINI